MADGTAKPIEEVDIGDQVVATDPDTGETTTKQVTALHLNQDWDLAELTIHNDETGQTTTLETTWNHPFWNATDHEWTNTADLISGDRLRDDEGKETQQVVAVRTWTGLQPMHDLTIAEVHTYYVIGSDAPVLVHNRGGGRYACSIGDDGDEYYGDGTPGIYDRPAGATNDAQRDFVNLPGTKCSTCSKTGVKMYADHKIELVREWYYNFKINMTKARDRLMRCDHNVSNVLMSKVDACDSGGFVPQGHSD